MSSSKLLVTSLEVLHLQLDILYSVVGSSWRVKMRHYKIWRVLEGLEGPKRPRCICFSNNIFRGSKLIHGYIVSCGRLLECLRVIVRRVLEGSWRVLEGLGGSGGYGRVREDLGGSSRV